jgi:hypothetical protein
MLIKVADFCQQVQSNLFGLVERLIEATNRSSTNEILAWQKSLPKLSIALSEPDLKDFHLSLGFSGGISLEYKLPAASAWCDAVLLGRGKTAPSAVMIELKDWDTTGIRKSSSENLVEYQGVLISHPSDQVRGYAEYCQNFHSTILNTKAIVAGCVFFTNAGDLSIYRQSPYGDLVSRYPVFSSQHREVQASLASFLAQHLYRPDFAFAKDFEAGTYAQNRSLMEQVANLILDDGKTVFVLLDEQRKGYELCLTEIDKILESARQDEKAIIIIKGPPGSGKSVLAAKLWAALAKHPRIRDSVVMTSTSGSQNSNWSSLFELQTNHRFGRGIIVKSNQYNPGLTNNWVTQVRGKGHAVPVSDWRRNVALYLQDHEHRMGDNAIEVSIVDEAHALVDPTVPNVEGVAASGWCVQAGPQGYHIIRSSRITVFLMDSEQSYRDNETTTHASLRGWASELGVNHVLEISLGDAQFRCGGSKEYVSWLDSLLGLSPAQNSGVKWRKSPDGTGVFGFDIVEDPEELDDRLSPMLKQGKSTRLVASYGRKWVTKSIANPHSLRPEKLDFHIPYRRNGHTKYWSRIWNYAPNQQYQLFVQAPNGSPMHENPLCEVGCPYVVRGFDYDFLGVLWLKDLVWRNGRWMVNLDGVFETAWNISLGRARKEQRDGIIGPNTETIIHRLQRGYRILLSRAIHGVFIWFEDEETREHVRSQIGQPGK